MSKKTVCKKCEGTGIRERKDTRGIRPCQRYRRMRTLWDSFDQQIGAIGVDHPTLIVLAQILDLLIEEAGNPHAQAS